MLLLFTDGVSDARNTTGARLGEERILEIVQTHREDAPETVVESIFAAVNEHIGETRRRDDLTVVALRS
jgi:serine phosphatase RsbU (regulator of sigma subunit)